MEVKKHNSKKDTPHFIQGTGRNRRVSERAGKSEQDSFVSLFFFIFVSFIEVEFT